MNQHLNKFEHRANFLIIQLLLLVLALYIVTSCSPINEKRSAAIQNEINDTAIDHFIRKYIGDSLTDYHIDTANIKKVFGSFSDIGLAECIGLIPIYFGRYNSAFFIPFTKDVSGNWKMIDSNIILLENIDIRYNFDTLTKNGKTYFILDQGNVFTGGYLLFVKSIAYLDRNFALQKNVTAHCEDFTNSLMIGSGNTGDTILNCNDLTILNDSMIEISHDLGIINARINSDSVTYNIKTTRKTIKNWWLKSQGN